MYLSGGLGSAATDLFDKGRQALWEEFLRLESQAKGGVTSVFLQQLQTIIAKHQALYDQARGMGASTAWLDPRFNDYQTVYKTKLGEWTAMLNAQSSGTGAPPISVTGAPTVILPSDMSQPTQMFISAPAGSAAAGGGAAPIVTGGGSWGGDAFAPAYSGQQAAAGGFGDYLPFIAGGLALAFLFRR